MLVLAVSTQVLCQLADPLSEDCHLDVCRAAVSRMQRVGGCKLRRLLFCQHPVRGIASSFFPREYSMAPWARQRTDKPALAMHPLSSSQQYSWNGDRHGSLRP